MLTVGDVSTILFSKTSNGMLIRLHKRVFTAFMMRCHSRNGFGDIIYLHKFHLFLFFMVFQFLLFNHFIKQISLELLIVKIYSSFFTLDYNHNHIASIY